MDDNTRQTLATIMRKKGEVKVSIHQPEYIPYRGHFFKISQADVHIFLDDVQAMRNAGAGQGWQYRNRFPDGYRNVEKSKIHLGSKINEVQIPNLDMSLADWNIPFIVFLSRELGYKTKFLRSSVLAREIEERLGPDAEPWFSSPTERLIRLTQYVGGTTYISGKGGEDYMDFDLFKQEGVKLAMMEFKDDDYLSAYYHWMNEGTEKLREYIKNTGKLEYV